MVQECKDQAASVVQHVDRLLHDGSRLSYAWFEAMHTRVDIVIWDKDISFDIMHESLQKICDETSRIENMASCFINDSETSVLNDSSAGDWVNVSAEFAGIISQCIRYSIETDGLFDAAASLETSGTPFHMKVEADETASSVRRLQDNVKVNLSGFLKGYALDRAVSIVRKYGFRNALVSFGNSSVYALGSHPGGEGWKVSIADGGKVYDLSDQCLTTSGNCNEERRHIINPHTGELIAGKGQVSVLTGSGVEGEVKSIVAFLKIER